jgi:hypothetical protein
MQLLDRNAPVIERPARARARSSRGRRLRPRQADAEAIAVGSVIAPRAGLACGGQPTAAIRRTVRDGPGR